MTTEQMDEMDGRRRAQEPSAASRLMARGLRDIYVALLAEGFTEKQAIGLLGQTIAASVQKAAE